MVKRLFVGLVLGLIVGGLVAAGVIAGLQWLTVPAAFFAYALAAVTGVLVGLVAGKPIWAQGGGIEGGLKAFFGALLAAGGMFALRTWVHTDVDLTMLHAGSGAIGDLPAASLPLIAAVLAGFYELDNTPDPEGKGAGRARIAAKSRIAEGAAAEDDEEEAAAPAAKKRTR
ncbi:MAG TPA: hypothetical protein VGI39_02090 [Polyangiaceae bacterium]|jgi:hypothetical protein